MSQPVTIDLSVEAGDWPPEDELAAIAARAMDATLGELGLAVPGPSELSMLFTDDARIAELNARWRGKDKPTNVLSFPASAPVDEGVLPPLLGDIVLARETIAAEAALDEKPFDHHLMHLIVHGLLHLLGHDHEDEDEAEAMEALERRVLARLAIPDPYG
jgi:probable rRNA maturation factor